MRDKWTHYVSLLAASKHSPLVWGAFDNPDKRLCFCETALSSHHSVLALVSLAVSWSNEQNMGLGLWVSGT